VFGWRDGTILFRCLIVRRVKNGIDGILTLLVVDPACYALDQKMWALDVNTQNRGGQWWLLATQCVSPHPHQCVVASCPAPLHHRTLPVWPPWACFGADDHHLLRCHCQPYLALFSSLAAPPPLAPMVLP
jgi:hypothetical protein